MKAIVQIGNPVLKRRAHKVKRIDDQAKRLIADLKSTLLGTSGARGLAAPQLGLPLRVIALKSGCAAKVIVNPEIVSVSTKSLTVREGCLSIPGVNIGITRPISCEWIGQDEHGHKIKGKASGMDARALQHEVDHLDGILITDRAAQEQLAA